MSPRGMLADSINGALAYSVLLRQSPGLQGACSNGRDILVGQLRLPVIHPLGGAFWAKRHATDVPALGVSVLHVGCMGAEEEMLGINASRRVAMMADAQPVGDRSVTQKPGVAVRSDGAAIDGHGTIAVAVECSNPHPALFGTSALHSTPKAGDSLFRCKLSSSHSTSYGSVVRGGEGFQSQTAPTF